MGRKRSPREIEKKVLAKKSLLLALACDCQLPAVLAKK
jgi:hypothetical protein